MKPPPANISRRLSVSLPTTIEPVMPSNPRQIVAEAERQFPIMIIIRVPEGGIGARYTGITDWLDENCGMVGGRSAPPERAAS